MCLVCSFFQVRISGLEYSAKRLSECFRVCDNKTLPLIIGIAGGSASGKTTFARNLARQLPRSCGIISVDDYTHDGKQDNYDLPASFDLALLTQHLAYLRNFSPVLVPHYDFLTGRNRDVVSFGPFDYILVEGLYALHKPVFDFLDFKVYIDATEEFSRSRRVARDVTERGRTEESVLHKWERHVLPAYYEYVQPQQSFAHVIIENNAYKA